MDLPMIEAGWLSVLPPLIAIILALITKEVYSSLFIGLFSGMLIYSFFTDGSIISASAHTLDMMCSKISDNAYMILAMSLLWAVIALVSKSGGTQAYGQWAGKRLNSKRSASFSTFILGILIFIDDGFNSLTVGNVMRPITDRLRISREKLAYLVDATSAPVCIMAPVSSWAVAIASEISASNGFAVYLSTLPYNFYAILTILMVIFICFTGKDFGPMKKAEELAVTQDPDESSASQQAGNGKVIDLVLPIVTLVVCAIFGMAYVGGFFRGVGFSEAIGANPSAGLTLGAFSALVMALCLYVPRKLMTARVFAETIVGGISSIVPPMLILILSWSLGGVCRQLIGTGVYISGFVSEAHLPLSLLPLLLFVIAAVMSFSMGSSWGTFGMLIPIVTMICEASGAGTILIPALGATLAGSVYGDHCSPISDTTILSSAGADCKHIRHVETQLPYATLVAIVCAAGYLITGFTLSPWVALAVEAPVLLGAIVALNKLNWLGKTSEK